MLLKKRIINFSSLWICNAKISHNENCEYVRIMLFDFVSCFEYWFFFNTKSSFRVNQFFNRNVVATNIYWHFVFAFVSILTFYSILTFNFVFVNIVFQFFDEYVHDTNIDIENFIFAFNRRYVWYCKFHICFNFYFVWFCNNNFWFHLYETSIHRENSDIVTNENLCQLKNNWKKKRHTISTNSKNCRCKIWQKTKRNLKM